MPSLKQLECYIEVGLSNHPLPEYRPVYRDGYVETFVMVPSRPATFSIHLKSLEYIASGLAMFVYIDGVPQCTRSCQNIVPGTNIDLRVRQKEEKMDESRWIGREWRFEKLNLVDDDSLADMTKEIFENIGTIEIVVLRCKNWKSGVYTVPQKKGSSAKALDTTVTDKVTRKVNFKEGNTKGMKSSDTSSDGLLSGLCGLFDGACDHAFGLDGGYDSDDVWSKAPSEKSDQRTSTRSQSSSKSRRHDRHGPWMNPYMQGYPMMQPGFAVPLQQPYLYPNPTPYYAEPRSRYHGQREGLRLVGEGRYEGGKRQIREHKDSQQSDHVDNQDNHDDAWNTEHKSSNGDATWMQAVNGDNSSNTAWGQPADQTSWGNANNHQSNTWNHEDTSNKEDKDDNWTAHDTKQADNGPQAWGDTHTSNHKPPTQHRSKSHDKPARTFSPTPLDATAILPTDPTKPLIKPYWTTQTSPIPQTPSDRLYITPALPLPALPSHLATAARLSHQVRAGAGALYYHRSRRPEYADSMQRPYAVFCFKYRSRAALRAILGAEMPPAEDAEAVKRRWMRERDKADLVEELARVKALVGVDLESEVSSGSWSGSEGGGLEEKGRAKAKEEKEKESAGWGAVAAAPEGDSKGASGWGGQQGDWNRSGDNDGGGGDSKGQVW